MHSITINVKDGVLDNILYLLNNLSDVEIVDERKKIIKTDEKWIYWKDNELDNFGKIAIGLSNHNYDDEDEDYSKW